MMIKLFAKTAVTALLFFLIAESVDLSSVGSVIIGAEPYWLIGALGFQYASTAIAAFRWRLIMRTLGFPGGFGFYYGSYFKAALFNQALPSSIGGDALRVLDIAKMGFQKREAFYGVFADRIVGLAGLLLLGIGANLAESDLLPEGIRYLILTISIGGLGGVAMLFGLRKVPGLERLKILQPFKDLSTRLVTVHRNPARAVGQLALSIVIHFCSILSIFALGQAVGVEVPGGIITYLALLPSVLLLTLVPVSLAGWGVREGAMVGLFALVGAQKSAVLSMSILYGITLILIGLIGLYYYFRLKRPKRQKASN